MNRIARMNNTKLMVSIMQVLAGIALPPAAARTTI
jgi:hypothetical protein